MATDAWNCWTFSTYLQGTFLLRRYNMDGPNHNDPFDYTTTTDETCCICLQWDMALGEKSWARGVHFTVVSFDMTLLSGPAIWRSFVLFPDLALFPLPVSYTGTCWFT